MNEMRNFFKNQIGSKNHMALHSCAFIPTRQYIRGHYVIMLKIFNGSTKRIMANFFFLYHNKPYKD